MAYKFKLETVLTYKRNLEELAQQALAKELMLLEHHKQRVEDIKQQRVETIGDFEEQKKKAMSGPLFSSYMDSLNFMDKEIHGVAHLIESQQQKVAQAREALAEKMRQRKVLEKARERDKQKFMAEEFKKEQNEIDEQVVLRFGRQQNLHQ